MKDQVVQVQNDANEVGRLQNGHGPWNDDMKMVNLHYLKLSLLGLFCVYMMCVCVMYIYFMN